jgi:hypothetical protein
MTKLKSARKLSKMVGIPEGTVKLFLYSMKMLILKYGYDEGISFFELGRFKIELRPEKKRKVSSYPFGGKGSSHYVSLPPTSWLRFKANQSIRKLLKANSRKRSLNKKKKEVL